MTYLKQNGQLSRESEERVRLALLSNHDPYACPDTCDIAAACRMGLVFVAAHLLSGATESTTAVQIVQSVIAEPYAWPGGYVRALVMDDGEILCPTCARENAEQILEATREDLGDGWEAIGSFHAGETDDHHQSCAHCGAEMVTW